MFSLESFCSSYGNFQPIIKKIIFLLPLIHCEFQKALIFNKNQYYPLCYIEKYHIFNKKYYDFITIISLSGKKSHLF